MKISVIGLGVYSLAISKMLAKKDNEIWIWTEDNKKCEEFKETKKVSSIIDTPIPKNIKTLTIKVEVYKASNNIPNIISKI